MTDRKNIVTDIYFWHVSSRMVNQARIFMVIWENFEKAITWETRKQSSGVFFHSEHSKWRYSSGILEPNYRNRQGTENRHNHWRRNPESKEIELSHSSFEFDNVIRHLIQRSRIATDSSTSNMDSSTRMKSNNCISVDSVGPQTIGTSAEKHETTVVLPISFATVCRKPKKLNSAFKN